MSSIREREKALEFARSMAAFYELSLALLQATRAMEELTALIRLYSDLKGARR